MPLLALWRSNRAAVAELSIEQLVATAGDGKLGDNSECSKELREYLSEVPSERLGAYAARCLSQPFPKSGYVLQDIVNELGRRLDYTVENGRYQGIAGGIGFDGLWHSPEGRDLVVEVKTTDAYRIPLDTLASYRSRLHQAKEIEIGASVLIVVGREDTGELEAQVRGSRHAWDMRLISIDALCALVALKESTEAGITGAKIRSILVPLEFTRLDALVDVLFATAKDVEASLDSDSQDAPAEPTPEVAGPSGWQFTDSKLLQRKRETIIDAIQANENRAIIKRTRALYWDASHAVRVACTVSKRYTKRGHPPYWYAFHPAWDEYLASAERGFLALGAMDLDIAFLIPYSVIKTQLPSLNTSRNAVGGDYWHLKIAEPSKGKFALQLPRTSSYLDLMAYVLPVQPM